MTLSLAVLVPCCCCEKNTAEGNAKKGKGSFHLTLAGLSIGEESPCSVSSEQGTHSHPMMYGGMAPAGSGSLSHLGLVSSHSPGDGTSHGELGPPTSVKSGNSPSQT